jgi:hypothetical protein
VREWDVFDGCGLCPRCRRVAPAGTRCELDGATFQALADSGLEAVLDAVWGARAHREDLRRRGGDRALRLRDRALTGLILGGIAAGITSALTTGTFETAVAGSFVGIWGVLAARTRRTVLIPAGGAVVADAPVVATGTILPCAEVFAAGSGTACAAWAVELRYEGSWGSRVTLRVGASAGLQIALDDGGQARIPAGPLWLDGAMPQVMEEVGALAELLAVLDPTPVGDPWPLFRHNVIGEQTLQAGDRVELHGGVDRTLVADQAEATYRDSPASELVPRGLPRLRRAARRR